MAIYNSSKERLNTVYDIDAVHLDYAYSVDKSKVYSSAIEDEIVVMSYNIELFGTRNTSDTIEAILKRHKPELVGIQEATHSTLPSGATTLFLEYSYQCLGNQSGYKTLALSKLPMEAEAGLYSVDGRGYVKAYVTVNDKTICWINTHLSTSSNESCKVQQSSELFNLVKDEPYFIITGDFNTVCKSVDDDEYITIMKQFVDFGCHSANCSDEFGFTPTWTDQTTITVENGYPCDHVITSPNITIKHLIFDDYKTMLQSSHPLDHLPVVAILGIN